MIYIWIHYQHLYANFFVLPPGTRTPSRVVQMDFWHAIHGNVDPRKTNMEAEHVGFQKGISALHGVHFQVALVEVFWVASG